MMDLRLLGTEFNMYRSIFEQRIQALIRDDDAQHLRSFMPNYRPDDEKLRFIDAESQINLLPEMLASTAPTAHQVFYGSWSEAMVNTMWVTEFVQGVSTLGIFMPEQQRESVGIITAKVTNGMPEHGKYPALSEKYAEWYSHIALSVLDNEEWSSREQLLSYNYGVWWALGHMKTDDVTVENNGEFVPIEYWIGRVLLERLHRAAMSEI